MLLCVTNSFASEHMLTIHYAEGLYSTIPNTKNSTASNIKDIQMEDLPLFKQSSTTLQSIKKYYVHNNNDKCMYFIYSKTNLSTLLSIKNCSDSDESLKNSKIITGK
jgi:hypothetical protein